MPLFGTLLLLVAASSPGPPSRSAPAPENEPTTAGDAMTRADSGRDGPCSPVQILSARERPRREPAFSASRSVDLGLRTLVRTGPRTRPTVEFRVFAPGGVLYQSLAAPADPPGVVPRSSTRDARATLLVAGTAITTNGLYGLWSVQALVDGRPCGGPAAFSLSP